MSIYIPHIGMPRNCQECFICTRCNGICDIADEVEYSVLKRPDGCSLIEVPEHGRLVDADALPWISGENEKGVPVFLLLKATVDSLPTIIPADKEGP